MHSIEGFRSRPDRNTGATALSFEIPNYRLLKKLGEGAMAEVWLAEHKRNDRKAAIKVLKPSALNDADAEGLFLREGQVLAGFSNRNIVAIYDNDRIGDLAYLVMEFLPGGTLLERMHRGPISVGEVVGLVVQVASALGAAHRSGIVHRDLKPANIMLRDETTPVLTDFGAVRVLDRSTIYGKNGGVIGTPVYMSPEQITGQPLDGRSDLYALGILFHELLTGALPYPGSSINEIVVQHLQARIPQLPEDVAMLQPILERLLAKQADQRFADAEEFIEALRNCFIHEAALRRQIGFAATSKAWSSQLRALGFVLDTKQKVEVRVAQGEHLQTAGPAPAARDVQRPVEPSAPPSSATPASAMHSSPRAVQLLDSKHGWLIGAAAVLLLMVGLVAAWPKSSGTQSTAVLSPPAPTPVVDDALVQRSAQAETAFDTERARLKDLATKESVDLSKYLQTVDHAAAAAREAMGAGDFAVAERQFNTARVELKGARKHLIDDLVATLAEAAEAAMTQGKLTEAEGLLTRAKSLRELNRSP